MPAGLENSACLPVGIHLLSFFVLPFLQLFWTIFSNPDTSAASLRHGYTTSAELQEDCGHALYWVEGPPPMF
jgi:hypothetical protein